MMYYLELYNGWGYYAHGVPSPYLFGATTVQRSGKYVADGVWSAKAMDKQLGCVAMLKARSIYPADPRFWEEPYPTGRTAPRSHRI